LSQWSVIVHCMLVFSGVRGTVCWNIRHWGIQRLRVQYPQLGGQLWVGVLRRHFGTVLMPVCISVVLLRRLLDPRGVQGLRPFQHQLPSMRLFFVTLSTAARELYLNVNWQMDFNVQLQEVMMADWQWRFYVGARGHRPPNLGPGSPKFLIGSIVISLSHCCLPNDEGPAPQILFELFPRTATAGWQGQLWEGAGRCDPPVQNSGPPVAPKHKSQMVALCNVCARR